MAVPAHAEPTGDVRQVSDIGPVGDADFDGDDPQLAFAPSGGGIAVFTGEPVDEEQEVYSRPFDAAGHPTGAQRRVTNVGTDGSINDQARNPDVVYDPRRDRFVLIYTDAIGFDEDVFAQGLGRDGAPAGGPVPVGETGGVGPGSDGDNQRPRIAYDPDRDEFLAVWIDGRDLAGDELRAQRLNAATLAQVGPDDFPVSTFGGPNTEADRLDVAYGGGGFLVAWGDEIADGDDEILIRRVTSGGAPVGGETQLSRQGADDDDGLESTRPAVAFNALSGEFLVAWAGEVAFGGGDVEQVHGRRVSAAGAPLGGVVRISQQDAQGDSAAPAVAADPRNGEYVVAWDNEQPDNEEEVHAQRLTAAGAEVGTNDAQVSSQGPAGDGNFGVGANAAAFNAAAGEFVVAWRGTRSFDSTAGDPEDEVFSRRLTSPFTPPAPPAPPPGPAVTAPVPIATTAPLRARDVIRFPSTRRCVSRRRFRIRLRRPGGVRLVSARVVLNGKRLPVLRGRRLTSAIVLRGLPKGRFRVKITVTTSTGKKLTGTRKYRTCTKKRRSKRPPPL